MGYFSDNLRIQEPIENNKSNVILTATKMSSGELVCEDLESNTQKNIKSSDSYYVKNRTSAAKTKPLTPVTPQLQVKFKSIKKSPSISSINMVQPTIIPFSSEDFQKYKSNTKLERSNPKTKESIHNPESNKDNDFLKYTIEESSMYDRVGISNVTTTPDITFGSNFGQSREYWQGISSKSIIKKKHQSYEQNHQPDRTNNAVNCKSKQENCQKQTTAIPHNQTHPTDIDITCTSNEQQLYMQIGNFQNFEKHKFPSYASGLSHSNVGVTATSLGSVQSYLVGRIQQPSPASSPLMPSRSTMKFIQNRSDETSCGSSFEQLNIIGIPTTSTKPSFLKQVTSRTQSSSSSHNDINNTERQTNKNYDIKFGLNSMERMKYSSEPKKRRPLPKLPIENMVSFDIRSFSTFSSWAYQFSFY